MAFQLNTVFGGLKRKRVVATIETKVEFDVGGYDDEDRIDSVCMSFDDHYDEIVNNSFFRDGISGMFLKAVDVVEDDVNEEKNNDKEEI